jgi:phosphopantothenoylcysteine decarboxylase/phosphopantothenate--cysteine ligase
MKNHPTHLLRQTSSNKLKDKTIVLAVTGSIAAVRTVELARELIRHGARVRAVMSEAAAGIINPDALHYATGEPVITRITGAVEHVEYCGEEGTADLLLIAPCTANTISKMTLGIDDTPPTTFAATAFGSDIPILLVPAMHGTMYKHPAVVENMEKLKGMGVHFVGPLIEENIAKITTNEEIVLCVQRKLGDNSLKNKRVIVTGGATMESIDPIRVLTNRASGRTGVALAQEAFQRGADVVLVHPGIMGLFGITEVAAESAHEMISKVLDEMDKGCDLLVSSAAISDYTLEVLGSKIKSGQELSLNLKPTAKLLQKVREKYPDMDIIGYKAETHVSESELLSSGRELLRKYNLSMVVANDVGEQGMGTEINSVFLLDFSGANVGPVTGTKQFIAGAIIDRYVGASK